MEKLYEITRRIVQCDISIAEALSMRLELEKQWVDYKKAYGIPILTGEGSRGKGADVDKVLENSCYADLVLNIMDFIEEGCKRVQAGRLFSDHVYLIGFMGTGKSSVSSCLSKALSIEEADIDAMIVKRENMGIPQIFEMYGEEYFRKCESSVLAELQDKKQLIVSCGGGIVLRKENIACMKKKGRIVLLTAAPSTILMRVKDSTERPILNNHMDEDYISSLIEKRRDSYMAAADLVVSTDQKPVQAVCEELVHRLSMSEPCLSVPDAVQKNGCKDA